MPGPKSPPSTKPNLVSMAGQRPDTAARGYCKNMLLEETGNPDFPDMITFPFRPAMVKLNNSVNDEEMTVMGQSHSYEVYTNTANVTVGFDLYYNALMQIKDTTSEGFKEGGKSLLNQMSQEIEKQRRWLESLFYPGYTSPGVVGGAQAPVILCLPGICTIRAKLKNMGEVIEDCDIEGNITALRLSVDFKEAPMGRVTMQDVLTNGMFRTWGA